MKQIKESDTGLRIALSTGEEIRADVSDNTLKAYEHATRKLKAWLEGRALSDASLAEYVRFLHEEGKSTATINLVLSAVKWMAEHRGIDPVAGIATERAVSAVREKGKGRGRRQVDGLTWDDVERVCAAAESADTVAGLRDAAMISLMSDCLLRISEVVRRGCGGCQFRRAATPPTRKRSRGSVYLRIDTAADKTLPSESQN